MQDADIIVVLDDGKISGVGSHAELLKTNEIYREVYESQQGEVPSMAEAKRRPGPHGPGGGQRHGYQKPKDMKGTVKKLLRYMGRYKGALVLVALCLLVSSGGSILSSYLLKPIINDYILPGDFPGLIKMLCLLGGAFACRACAPTPMRGSWSTLPRTP